MNGLIERLRRRVSRFPLQSPVLVNPDGPEAADALATLSARLAEVEKERDEAVRQRDEQAVRYHDHMADCQPWPAFSRAKAQIAKLEAALREIAATAHHTRPTLVEIATAIRKGSDNEG